MKGKNQILSISQVIALMGNLPLASVADTVKKVLKSPSPHPRVSLTRTCIMLRTWRLSIQAAKWRIKEIEFVFEDHGFKSKIGKQKSTSSSTYQDHHDPYTGVMLTLMRIFV